MGAPKVQMLPGVATTPQVFLRQLESEENDIEHIMAVVMYKDGHTETFWTEMKAGDKVWMKYVFDDEINKSLEGRG